MARMVRKQIYIQQHQDRLLKRLSQERGVSEAEIVRRAIDREVTEALPQSSPRGRAAWERILEFVEARNVQAARGIPYRWRRDDAYEERESHYSRGDPRDTE